MTHGQFKLEPEVFTLNQTKCEFRHQMQAVIDIVIV